VKCVLLAGGQGTRMREESELRPKPMMPIGSRPILWHIMKNFSHFGVNEYVVCTGFKGEMIKQYFMNFYSLNSDFTVNLQNENEVTFHDVLEESDWKVTVADTGQDTMTGGRVKRVQRFLENDSDFLCTYGDGLADVNIQELIEFHKSHGKIATVTAVRPTSRFGVMEIDSAGIVQSFREKPQVDGWINVGFFVFNNKIFDYLNDDSVLENEPLTSLADQGELMAFKHDGFWQPMDTYREYKIFNELLLSGQSPWKSW
jgi:glucose-1-phosphate cytidylyltransferase